MRILILLIISLFSFIYSFCQRQDQRLQHKMEELVKGFNGQLGIFVHDLKKNKMIAINADTVFSTASMIKIPILIGVMDKINKRELNYHQDLVYKDSLLYAGVDIVGSLKNNEKIELSKVMMLMLTMSDNTASLWLQSLAGGGSRINEIIDSLGVKNTRVNSRTAGREEFRNQYGWGQTTPREMAAVMEKIVNGEVINKAASEKMVRLLGRNYWDEVAISQVPPDVFVASKHGSLNQNRNEVLYVNGNKSRYIFCICTQNNKDESWSNSNEAWTLTRKLSFMLWKYYNKHSNWQPSIK